MYTKVILKVNHHLEQIAFAFLYEYFSQKAPNGTISDIIKENDKSKIQVGKAKKTSGIYPFYTSGTSILTYEEWLVDGRNIMINTGGVAGINFYIGKAGYSTDTWSIYAKDRMTDYLYLVIKDMIDEINNNYFHGSALKHLQKHQFRNIPIYIPNISELDLFNSKVIPIFNMINANISQNVILINLRDSLLPKLMSGEITID